MRALALAVSMTAPVAAGAADDARLQALEQRIHALEEQAQALREQAASALEAAHAAQAELEKLRAAPEVDRVAAVAAPAPVPAGGNANAFNPAISLILDGVYAHHSMSPDDYARSGFPIVGEGGPLPRGLSLGETELAFAANIDDKFYGQATIALGIEDGDTQVELEEAYIETTALPRGFTLRAGRFLSNIGYLNSHHAHTDAFTERPLAYQAFVANAYDDDGVQLRWLAPLDFFLEAGGELFRGEHFPADGAGNGGIGARTLFVHAGGDVGAESSWLGGVSMLRTRADDAADGFHGDSTLTIADLTWKWAPNGNTKDGGLTLRGEYFDEDRAASAQRRGAYLEGVWRINRIWDAGYRYDRLWSDLASDDPMRHTLELTWHNSEFALVRLSLAHDEPRQDRSDNVVALQYQVNLGAHGAHKF
jgi:hypothetical protein